MDTVDQQTGEILPYRPKMPPAIAAAIVQVKKEVKQLGKDEENKFAKFNYVSVDKFYDVIGRLMAKAGLFIVTDETSIAAETREAQTEQGQVKKSIWITATYELTLFHESGAEYGPIHRTIMVQATGPQAFGSGVSYVEKYFLRSLFKVPTGEQDVDAAPQEGVPETVVRNRPRPVAPSQIKPAAATPPSSPRAVAFTGDWLGWGQTVANGIKGSSNGAELDAWLNANNDILTDCQAKAPKVYDRIMAIVDDMRDKRGPDPALAMSVG